MGLILILGLALRAAAPVVIAMRFAEPYWLLLLGLLPLLWRWGFGLVINAGRALKRLGDPASLRSNQSGEPRRRLVKLLAANVRVGGPEFCTRHFRGRSDARSHGRPEQAGRAGRC